MDAIQQSTAVAAVLLLLVATVWWLQRRGLARVLPRGRASRRMESVERLPLAPQHALHLVRVAGRVLLIGVSPSGCAVLGELSEADLRGAAPGAQS